MTRESQLSAISIAALVWSVWGAPVFGALVLSYVAAWILVNYAPKLSNLFRGRRAWLLYLAAIVALGVRGKTAFPRIVDAEQLQAFFAIADDRRYLEQEHVIWPTVVHDDRPQTFYVRSKAQEVSLALPDDSNLQAAPLGHGLFRLDYDPRMHGVYPRSATNREGKIAMRLKADGATVGRRVRSIHHTSHPRWMCAKQGEGAAVSLETDTIHRFDQHGNTTATKVGDGPFDCAYVARWIAVSLRFDKRVQLISQVAGAAEPPSLALPGPPGHLDAHGQHLAVAVSSPPAIHITTVTSTGAKSWDVTLPLDSSPDGVLWSPPHIVVALRYPARLVRYTPDENGTGWRALVAPIDIGRPAVVMSASHDRKRTFIAVTDYRPDGSPGPNHFSQDQILEIDVDRWQIMRRITTAETDADGFVLAGASPFAVLETSMGLRVAFAGTHEVRQLDAAHQWRTLLTTSAPHDLVQLDRDVWAVSSPVDGTITVATASTTRTITTRRREHPGAVGEKMFFTATRSGLSCQTCHLHSDSDHAAHDIGHEVPRPTLSVRGIAGTAPYLRGASYPAVEELRVFAQTILGDYHTAPPNWQAHVADYVYSLPREPSPSEESIETLRRGMDAFVEARCIVCHTPGAFTDLAQYPETLIGGRDPTHLVDTPSLIGIHESAPYLHDASASKLHDVILSGNGHGDADSLSPSERDALIRFLRAL